jgi:ribosomal protein L3
MNNIFVGLIFLKFYRIGFGFQGVMKKWGMKGGPRSHGATKFHRKRGSIGSGRVCYSSNIYKQSENI